ncbi:hypothetical protein JCM33374_g4819 [Metschnikowia sp. JCM 33374]|nr:hypothetical protein JCM33374_g4819 [Metschnikowia sp. JCM 33374]
MVNLSYAALLASAVSAASIPSVQNNHLKLDFSVWRGDSRSTATKGGKPKIATRDAYGYLSLTNAESYYSSTLQIGSNGDQNTVLVDTGSSDLWVMASNVSCFEQTSSKKRSIDDFPLFIDHPLLDFEEESTNIGRRSFKRDGPNAGTSDDIVGVNPSVCTSLGSFNAAGSSSHKFNTTAPKFSIEYGDGTFANGAWGTDTVKVGGFSVPDLSIASVDNTTSEFGIFGIGLAGLEVTHAYGNRSNGYEYENFPVRLKSTGVINKVAYSLYLNDPNAESGSVLFGAVDHAKYSGQLQTVPIINIYSKIFKDPIAFYVGVDSVTLGDSEQSLLISNDTIPALLDSGTTLSYLPAPLVDAIAESLNGTASNVGYYEVDCGYSTSSAFISYNFSGVQIQSPLSDLILEDTTGTTCYLGLVASRSRRPSAILGDSFLRHAYVVYNLEDYEISLAPVKYSDSENIDVISSTIPSAVQAPGYSSTTVATSVTAQPVTALLSLTSSASTSVSSPSPVVSVTSVSSSSEVVSTTSLPSSSVASSSAASTSSASSSAASTSAASTSAASSSAASSSEVSLFSSVASISSESTYATGASIASSSSIGGSTSSVASATSGSSIISVAQSSSYSTSSASESTPTYVSGSAVSSLPIFSETSVSSSTQYWNSSAISSTLSVPALNTNSVYSSGVVAGTSTPGVASGSTVITSTSTGSNGVVTTYTSTSSGPVVGTSTGAGSVSGAANTYTTSTTAGALSTDTVTNIVATTIITITSCSDHKCTKTAVPATQGPTTVTTNGETTVYTTWCPLTATAATSTSTDSGPATLVLTGANGPVITTTIGGGVGTASTASAGTTVITSTSTGANGVVTTYTSTATGAVVGTPSTGATDTTVYVTVTRTDAHGSKTTYTTTTGVPAVTGGATSTGVSTVAPQYTTVSSTTASGVPAISSAFNGAGKVGASLVMFAIPLAYFL